MVGKMSEMDFVDELIADGAAIDITFVQGDIKIVAENIDLEKFRFQDFQHACWEVIAAIRGWDPNNPPDEPIQSHIAIAENALLTKAKADLIEMHRDLHGD